MRLYTLYWGAMLLLLMRFNSLASVWHKSRHLKFGDLDKKRVHLQFYKWTSFRNMILILMTLSSTSFASTVIAAPDVSSVSVPASGIYSVGQSLFFTVNFDTNVGVTGTPLIGLFVGSTSRNAVYMSGSGSSSLLFSYTVQAGDIDNDGIAVGALSLNGGSIQDSSGQAANLVLNRVSSTAGILVGYSPPTLTSVSPNLGPTAGGTSVSLLGTNLAGATAVNFGSTSAFGVVVNSSTQITATAPAGTGIVNVSVTTPGGTATLTNAFTYIASPPIAGPVSATVAANSSANPITLNITGGTPNSVMIVAAPSHGSIAGSGASISYTPAAGYTGTDSFTYTATNAGGTSNTATVTITVTAPTIAISPATLPNSTVGTAYSQTLAASGGTAPYSYAITVGALPSGMTLSSAGVLNGTPTAGGTFNFTVTSTDSSTGSGPYTGSRTYSLPVSVQVPTTGNVSATVAANSTNNPMTLNLGGGAASSVAIGSAASHGTATASGTSITYSPTAGYAGADSFTYTASNAAGVSAPATVTITVTAPTISISPATLPNSTVGNAYSQTLAASGGTAPYSYAITAGALPSGMTLSSTGVLSGTPTAGGTFNFTVTSTDTYHSSGSRAYSLTVSAPTISIAPATLLNSTVGNAYSQNIIASGGTAPYSYAITTGALPAGLSLSSNGSLSGTPTAGGTFNFIIRATDASTGTGPFTGSRSYSLLVNDVVPGMPTIGTAIAGDSQATVTFTAPAFNGGSVITGYTVTASPGGATASGSRSPITVTGLNNGTSYTFTVTATNSAGTGATSAASNSVVPKGTQSIIFANPGPQNFGTTPTLTASSSSGLAPSFTSSTTGVCTIASGGALTFVTAGSCTINANQAGNAVYQAASTASQTFTVASVAPGAPTIGTATAGNSQATVTFAAPASNGGSAITGYTVTASPDGATATGSSSPITVTGLNNGTSYTFTVTAANSAGTGAASAASNAVTALQAPTANNSSATVAANSSANPITLNITGGTASSVAIASAASHGTATASGTSITYTPTAGYAGSDRFTYTATNATGTSSAATVSITVSPAILSLNPTSLPNGTKNTAYSATLTANGGTAPYSFSIASGALPSGLSLNTSSGAITGTPAAIKNSNFDIKVVDQYGSSGIQNYSINIVDAIPSAGAVSASIAANSSANPITLNITGGTPSSVAIASAASHGTATASGTSITYTPTAGYAGPDNFTYTATNATGTSSAATVSITVSPAILSLNPTSLPNGTKNTAYSATLTANGGTAPYSFSIASGALPSGLSLNTSSGAISGTPAVIKNSNFDIKVVDQYGSSGIQNYSINIVDAIPSAGAVSATVAANSSTNPITLNITGGTASSVAIAAAASHGTATASGTSITYTPTAGYAGSDSFTYTATNATGTSSAATVSITVSAPILSLSANGLIDTTVGSPYLAAVTATGGTAPYIYRVISGALATGLQLNSATGEISGTPSVIEQTSFSIEATDAYGFKTTAHYSLEVKQRQPIASNVNISVKANTPVDVDLTQGAIGGPFTGATVVSMSPTDAGTVTIGNNGAAYIMTFTPSRTFSGNALIRYTLSNTAGTSAPATVTFNVAPRYDLSTDPEVTGLVSAQANAAKRFASTQMANFTNRLESLHGDGWNGSKFGLNVAVNKASSNNTEVQDQFSISPSVLKNQGNLDNPKDPTVSTETEKSEYFNTATPDYKRLAIWVNGTIDYGRATQDHDDSEYRFTTNGISAGVDYRLNDFITLGTGIGFGHDNSRIGKNGSKSMADSISAIIYSSLRPAQDVFLDGLFGYGSLNFDSKRYITNEGDFAIGSRDGQHYFGAISTGMEFSGSSWMWSPYSRLEITRAELKPFTETASDLNALTYFKQNISVLNGIVGLRGQGTYPVLWGKLLPKVRVEYSHSLQDDDKATLAYADLADLGPAYQINTSNSENSNWTIGLGSGLILKNAIELNMEYGTNLDRDFNQNQSIQLGVNFPF